MNKNKKDEDKGPLKKNSQESAEGMVQSGEEKIPVSKKEFEELTKRAAERDNFYDTMLRKQAELENTRKRLEKEKLEFSQFAGEKIISELLPIIDNLDRAIAHMQEGTELDSLKEGILMIQKQLHQILEDIGLRKIESIGHKFDPHLHEAIMVVESDKHPDETILDEIRCGYMLNDRLLRPAIVKIAKHKELNPEG